ncbi:MAG: thioredoxin family protein [Proteobacteria bacterium]|nr:thioredoxin family protein [Pseudomonadota bacterium]
MIDRRTLFLGAALPLVTSVRSLAGTLGEDGLYHQDWFVDTFLDLAEDVAAATQKGKRFAVLWGLKGCPACKTMHEVHFADPATTDYIRARFDIVHLNILGDKEVTDFDGRKRGEKAFAAHYAIRTTPSIQFFGTNAEGLAAKEPLKREVARMPGLLDPKAFLAMFRYVAEEGYTRESFAEWARKNGA